ncbi:hypothetical protein ACRAWG_09860 [Methylobacterium sp. P31]
MQTLRNDVELFNQYLQDNQYSDSDVIGISCRILCVCAAYISKSENEDAYLRVKQSSEQRYKIKIGGVGIGDSLINVIGMVTNLLDISSRKLRFPALRKIKNDLFAILMRLRHAFLSRNYDHNAVAESISQQLLQALQLHDPQLAAGAVFWFHLAIA